jgi:hypothetical protein
MRDTALQRGVGDWETQVKNYGACEGATIWLGRIAYDV